MVLLSRFSIGLILYAADMAVICYYTLTMLFKARLKLFLIFQIIGPNMDHCKSNSFMSSIYFFRPDVLHKLHRRDSSSPLVFCDVFLCRKKVTIICRSIGHHFIFKITWI